MNKHFFALACLFFFSCDDYKKSADKKVFYYNESNSVTSLDPAQARTMPNIWAVNQLFNGLVQMDSKLNLLPCIAKRWNVQDSGRKFTFYLRDDVYFQEDSLFGPRKTRRVIASDVAYSFKRILDPATASTGSWIFSSVKGVEAGNPSFTAINDSCLVIELEKPFPAFLSLLCNMYCAVVPREVTEHYGKDFRSHPIGTGPFQFSRWKEGEKLIFLKNPLYFEKDFSGHKLPYLDAISISFLSDKQSEFMEFIQGRLDFLNTIDASYKDELLTHTGKLNPKYNDRFTMVTEPFLNTEYLGILMEGDLMKQSPLKQKTIRQALAYGFDRKRMMAYLRNNIGTPGLSGIIPVGLAPYKTFTEDGYNYDPEKVKTLLNEAGFPNGLGMPEIVLAADPRYTDLCEYLQGQWNELGIKTRLEVNQGASHKELVSKQKLGFFRASWIADYPDAESYLSLFYSKKKSPKGPNTTHYDNPAYDKLYEAAVFEPDSAKRMAIYRQLNQMLLSDCPFIVLYYDMVLHLYQKGISGMEPNPMNWVNFKKVRKN